MARRKKVTRRPLPPPEPEPQPVAEPEVSVTPETLDEALTIVEACKKCGRELGDLVEYEDRGETVSLKFKGGSPIYLLLKSELP